MHMGDSLATFWGWHFHRVLGDLRSSIKDDCKTLEADTSYEVSPTLQLFRRSWPVGVEGFWFRWAFFDEDLIARAGEGSRIASWRAQKLPDAASFLQHLSQAQVYAHLSAGTRDHIVHLQDEFFERVGAPREFIDDWLATYLQCPTNGTILGHLWEAHSTNVASPASAFIVRPDLSRADEFGAFPPFTFRSLASPVQHVQRQQEIGLMRPTAGGRESQFFQTELFPLFYSAEVEEGGTVAILRRLRVGMFVFIPVYLGRTEDSKQWIGVVQVELRRRSESGDDGFPLPGGPIDRFASRIAPRLQVLLNDLMLAQIQEAFDRPFNSADDVETFHERGALPSLGLNGHDVPCKATARQLEHLFDAEYERVRLKTGLGERKQRYAFAHSASTYVSTILSDPNYERLAQGTRDAAWLLWLDVYLWREVRVRMSDEPKQVDLNKIGMLAASMARRTLVEKLEVEKKLEADLSDAADKLTREALRQFLTQTPRPTLSTSPQWLFADQPLASVTTRWPNLLIAVLVQAARQALAHGIISQLRQFDTHQAAGWRNACCLRVEERSHAGLAFIVANPSVASFEPRTTSEYGIIAAFAAKSAEPDAIAMEWDVRTDAARYWSRVTLVDPSAGR